MKNMKGCGDIPLSEKESRQRFSGGNCRHHRNHLAKHGMTWDELSFICFSPVALHTSSVRLCKPNRDFKLTRLGFGNNNNMK